MPDREKPLNSPGYSRRRSPESAPTARTAFGRMEAAVQAIHAGAYDSKSYCVHTASFPQEPTTAAIGNDSKSYCAHTASFPRAPTLPPPWAAIRNLTVLTQHHFRAHQHCRHHGQRFEILLCSHSIISARTNDRRNRRWLEIFLWSRTMPPRLATARNLSVFTQHHFHMHQLPPPRWAAIRNLTAFTQRHFRARTKSYVRSRLGHDSNLLCSCSGTSRAPGRHDSSQKLEFSNPSGTAFEWRQRAVTERWRSCGGARAPCAHRARHGSRGHGQRERALPRVVALSWRHIWGAMREIEPAAWHRTRPRSRCESSRSDRRDRTRGVDRARGRGRWRRRLARRNARRGGAPSGSARPLRCLPDRGSAGCRRAGRAAHVRCPR